MARTRAGNILRDYNKVMREAVYTTLYNASTDVQSNLRDVVRNWKNKPDFGDTFDITRRRTEVLIKPKGNKKAVRIFGYVDQGTKGPYLIPKFLVPGRNLKFRTGYSAMTQPVARYNVGIGRSFGSWVTKKQVVHPGLRARNFIKTFFKELAPPLEVRLQQELNRQLT